MDTVIANVSLILAVFAKAGIWLVASALLVAAGLIVIGFVKDTVRKHDGRLEIEISPRR